MNMLQDQTIEAKQLLVKGELDVLLSFSSYLAYCGLLCMMSVFIATVLILNVHEASKGGREY